MIEKNTRAAEHVVGFAVLLDDPIAVEFGHGVGAVGVERSLLVLRDLLYLAVKFGSRGLIDAAGLGKSALAYGLEDAQYARSIDVGRELRSIERNLHMALSRQVINLVRTYFSNDLQNTHRVAEVGVMQVEMRFSFQMSNTLAVIGR